MSPSPQRLTHALQVLTGECGLRSGYRGTCLMGDMILKIYLRISGHTKVEYV